MKRIAFCAALAAMGALGALKDVGGNAVTRETPFADVDGETGTVGDFLSLSGRGDDVAAATNAVAKALRGEIAAKADAADVYTREETDEKVASAAPDLAPYAKRDEVPSVPAWALEPERPVYTASEVGALASTVTHLPGDVPTSRKVNGQTLDADVTLGAADVGAYTKEETDDRIRDAGTSLALEGFGAFVTNAVTNAVAEARAEVMAATNAATRAAVAEAKGYADGATNAVAQALRGEIAAATPADYDAVKAKANSALQPAATNGLLRTESDPTVPVWAKAATKPTYTASEVGAFPVSAKTVALGGVSYYANDPLHWEGSRNGTNTLVAVGSGSVEALGFTPDYGYLELTSLSPFGFLHQFGEKKSVVRLPDESGTLIVSETDPAFAAWKKSNSVAVGQSASAAQLATAVGPLAKATGLSSAAFGYNAQAKGGRSLALGYSASTTNEQSVAIGYCAVSHGINTFNVSAKSPSDFYLGDRSLQTFLDDSKTNVVTSVNGQSGVVTLGAADVGAYTKAEVDAAITASVAAATNGLVEIPEVPVKDVKVDGVSVVKDKIANVVTTNFITREEVIPSDAHTGYAVNSENALLATKAEYAPILRDDATGSIIEGTGSGFVVTNETTGKSSALVPDGTDFLTQNAADTKYAKTSDIPTDYVPNTRTVNGLALNSDIRLSAADVGALPAYVDSDGFYNFNGSSRLILNSAVDMGPLQANGGIYSIGDIQSSGLITSHSLTAKYIDCYGLNASNIYSDVGFDFVLPRSSTISHLFPDGSRVMTYLYTRRNFVEKDDISATDPTFSNAVLSVCLNIDTNSVAVLNEIAETFGGFPIEGTATSVGGLLLALAAAIAWLKKNKAGKDEVLPATEQSDGAYNVTPKTEFENGIDVKAATGSVTGVAGVAGFTPISTGSALGFTFTDGQNGKSSILMPDGSDVVTRNMMEAANAQFAVADGKPTAIEHGKFYSFKPSSTEDAALTLSTGFDDGEEDEARLFFDCGTAAPNVTFPSGVTVLYEDGSVKLDAIAISGNATPNRYMVELKWFQTSASGTPVKYVVVNCYKVTEG